MLIKNRKKVRGKWETKQPDYGKGPKEKVNQTEEIESKLGYVQEGERRFTILGRIKRWFLNHARFNIRF